MKSWTVQEVLEVVRDLNALMSDVDAASGFTITNSNDFLLGFTAEFGPDDASIHFAGVLLWASGDGDPRSVDDDGEPTITLREYVLIEFRRYAASIALLARIGE